MRLINVDSLKLESFPNDDHIYAILSHTWETEEVTFQDIIDEGRRSQIESWKGYQKILSVCKVAQQDGWKYVWVDTCCIDKTSSAELSEAINSMFSWYRKAQVCYIYLADVPDAAGYHNSPHSAFSHSRWFKRGWTLQELIAPSFSIFFDAQWREIGTKADLHLTISEITRILPEVVRGHVSDPAKITRFNTRPVGMDPRSVSISEKMCWAYGRETTRPEDMAYSLMGLFDVNMALLYGEGGTKAFVRLQEEIMRVSNDPSIFVWLTNRKEPGLLAESPSDFYSGDLQKLGVMRSAPKPSSYTLSKSGLEMELLLIPPPPGNADYFGLLDCWPSELPNSRVALYLYKRSSDPPVFSRFRHTALQFYTGEIPEQPTKLLLATPRSTSIEPVARYRVPLSSRRPIIVDYHLLGDYFVYSESIPKYNWSVSEEENVQYYWQKPTPTTFSGSMVFDGVEGQGAIIFQGRDTMAESIIALSVGYVQETPFCSFFNLGNELKTGWAPELGKEILMRSPESDFKVINSRVSVAASLRRRMGLKSPVNRVTLELKWRG